MFLAEERVETFLHELEGSAHLQTMCIEQADNVFFERLHIYGVFQGSTSAVSSVAQQIVGASVQDPFPDIVNFVFVEGELLVDACELFAVGRELLGLPVVRMSQRGEAFFQQVRRMVEAAGQRGDIKFCVEVPGSSFVRWNAFLAIAFHHLDTLRQGLREWFERIHSGGEFVEHDLGATCRRNAWRGNHWHCHGRRLGRLDFCGFVIGYLHITEANVPIKHLKAVRRHFLVQVGVDEVEADTN
mmetsp:Transcript_37861/g.104103  ORF Transcript_37861/g.104103 Transcript_37861/m.104103 type:complete len:243 (-) Transcript_37861:403-1131(-)